jgi:hypothetical protein
VRVREAKSDASRRGQDACDSAFGIALIPPEASHQKQGSAQETDRKRIHRRVDQNSRLIRKIKAEVLVPNRKDIHFSQRHNKIYF